MEVIFLGTGTSQGLPLIADPNTALDLKNPRNWRTRSSIHVTLGAYHLQIDAAPEFRLQCLREDIAQVDTFILTHGHSDHLMGMDDLRRFCDLLGGALPVYASAAEGLPRIETVFYYALQQKDRPIGYPFFKTNPMPASLTVPGGCVHSTLLPHGKIEVLGLVFEEAMSGKRVAYYSDCHEVPPGAKALAAGVDVLIIDGLRHKPHSTHMTVAAAIAVAEEVKAKATYLTHLGVCMDHEKESAKLPAGVYLAYDGLRLTI